MTLSPWNSEPIDETVEFFAEQMRVEDWSADEYVIFILGGSDELQNEVREAVRTAFN